MQTEWDKKPNADLADRLWRRVRFEDGCWVYIGTLNWKGYGMIGLNHKNVKTHRVAYEMLRGSIPEGLQLDHLCRNRACVNPFHMEAVTCRENVRRGLRACPRPVCKNGHDMVGQQCRAET